MERSIKKKKLHLGPPGCEGRELFPGGQIFIETAFHDKTSFILRYFGDPDNNLCLRIGSPLFMSI
jgi:hypothetical protein